MSVIETFYNTTCTCVRHTTGTPTSSDTITTVSSSFIGVIRPVSEVARLFVENNIGNEFDFVTDEDNDIIVGDRIYITGAQYSVLGVATYEDLEDDSDSYLNVRLNKN